MRKINETTLIPISLVVILVGGIVWLSQLYAKTDQNGIDIKDLKEAKEKQFDILQDIRERVIRIETKVDEKRK